MDELLNQDLHDLSEMPPGIRAIRSRILDAFQEKNADGLDIQRVETFISSQGLYVTPYILYSSSDIPKIVELLQGSISRSVFQERPREGDDEPGDYLRELDLAFILREVDWEEKNGSIHTESRLVHELAHGTNARSIYRREGITLIHEWPGQFDYFLEEGFAEYQSGSYIKQNIQNADSGELADIIKRRGYSLDDTWPVPDPFHNIWLPVPLKYVFFTPRSDKYPDREMISVAALPAFTLDLLIQKYPYLEGLLVAARTSQKSGQELENALTDIDPGLFQKFSKAREPKDLFSCLFHVADLTNGGIMNTIKVSGNPLAESWVEFRESKPFQALE